MNEEKEVPFKRNNMPFGGSDTRDGPQLGSDSREFYFPTTPAGHYIKSGELLEPTQQQLTRKPK